LNDKRVSLGDAVVEPTIAALHRQLAQLKAGTIDRPPADERKVVTIMFVDTSKQPLHYL
jgi:hypothetical protein